jgi:UDPglucose 6-dehydrogenase
MLLVTEWPEFIDLDFKKVKLLLKNPIIIDGRNALDKQKLKKEGIIYFGVGR